MAIEIVQLASVQLNDPVTTVASLLTRSLLLLQVDRRRGVGATILIGTKSEKVNNINQENLIQRQNQKKLPLLSLLLLCHRENGQSNLPFSPPDQNTEVKKFLCKT